MKMFAAVLLSILTIPAQAQRLLGGLETHQKEITPKSTPNSDPSKPDIKIEPVGKTKTAGQCTEQDQTSLPLSYITSLIMEKDGKLEISHDARSGKLSVSSPDMISNCSSMIELVPNARVVDGRRVYSLEAKIKKTDDCSPEEGCSYDVARVEKNQFKKFEKMKFKPTLVGFEECLEKSGVVTDGKVVEDAIYPSTIDEKFEGYKESGELLFMSHGPASKIVKAKYDKFVEIDKCDHYEKILPNGLTLQSLEDSERERILSEKAKIRECGEYEKIADFIEKYQGYSDDLNVIRDQLILDAVKKSAKAIQEGKYSEEDLKAISDFEKYIVQPKTDLAALLYQEAQGLEGDEKTARLTQMKAILGELASYTQAPFVTAALVQKLEDNGRFEDAARANGIRALIVSHARLGAKENGVIITPDVAKLRAASLKQAYATELEDVKEKYEIRTGQTSGQAQAYAQLASRMQQNIQIRTRNFTQEISEEYARVQQPNGYCYRSPFRNVQRCIQRSMERIQELQAQMQHFNKVDAERAVEYQTKAQEYAKLEKEGRAYVARQNGEEVPTEAPVDNTMPQSRTEEGYTFDFQGQGQQWQPQYNPYQPQGLQQFAGNPYQQQGQPGMYNPYQQHGQGQMGQQLYGQFNFGAQYGGAGQQQYGYYNQSFNPYQQQGQPQYNPYQQSMFGMNQPPQQQFNPYQQYSQPQQQGYWSNPYQAYAGYSMYR